jgi:hypothetical protein
MPGVIDGRRWWQQRIAHLEQALRGDLSDEQRAEIEAELARARMELRHNRRWLRWLLWGHR